MCAPWGKLRHAKRAGSTVTCVGLPWGLLPSLLILGLLLQRGSARRWGSEAAAGCTQGTPVTPKPPRADGRAHLSHRRAGAAGYGAGCGGAEPPGWAGGVRPPLCLHEVLAGGVLGAAGLAWLLTAILPGLCHGPLLAGICRLAGDAGSRSHLPLPHGAALPGRQPPVPLDVEVQGGLEAPGGLRESHGLQERGQPRWSPPTPCPPGIPPSARARRVVFEDEVMPSGRPSGRVPTAEEGKKPGARSIPPGLAPRPRAVPDYVVKYPAIRSPRQREGYKGVFQDQLAEYTELLGEVRTAQRRLRETEAAMGRLPRHDGSKVAHVWHEYMRKKRDSAFLEKQQRCEYLKKKLTHIKARIQEYDRDARDSAVYF
uniref:Occludin/ELL domain containing 1 n=1 Tax=Aquila chrysaetos chrysaetos TaxID=223781 RepID=A0A663E5S0_AQUCH